MRSIENSFPIRFWIPILFGDAVGRHRLLARFRQQLQQFSITRRNPRMKSSVCWFSMGLFGRVANMTLENVDKL
jgi:hypothetical protein